MCPTITLNTKTISLSPLGERAGVRGKTFNKPRLSNHNLAGYRKSPSMGFFNYGSGKRSFPLPSFSIAYGY